ncbi:hypothetical protein PR202_gb04452 [Eleusine coracana subsp. coracana]|uniref:Uncharacterized protein n=1 Tax=Eleusine coracana subsp. coracana TaxID=191504 RepID=A0AAV5E444_ELECO|nr:hypothetical protein PR202_gb04452 [Eleusine coracana subsp. coracana]
MYRVKSEDDCEMILQDQMDSPVADDDFTSDNFISDALSYAPQLSAVSISNLLGQSFASRMDRFSNDSDKLKQALGFDYLNEANACSKNVTPFGVALSGSHAFLNGTFSASRPINGPLKMELPSLQDTESDPNSWLKYTVAPAMQPTDGLLEELLHEAQVLRSGKNQQLSVRSSSSSAGTPCETTTAVSPEFDICQEYWEEHPSSFNNEYTPFSGNSFTESTPPVSAASPDIFQLSKVSPVQSPSMGSGDHVTEIKYEPGGSPHPENFRPDALFSGNTADASIFNDAIAMLLGNDISSTWSNMPHAYEMSEFK